MIADLNPLGGNFLPIKKAALVPIDFVRAASGISQQRILSRLQRGDYLWVWNIAASLDHNQNLRFLAAELCAPDQYRKLTLAQVITGILGAERRAWPLLEVSHMLMISKLSAYKMVSEKALKLTPCRTQQMVSHDSLVAFLTERRVT